jgi:signal transduction histidine kinase
LSYTESAVTLEVCDDGGGFEIPQQLQEFTVQGHYGLIGIHERIVPLGGRLNLNSELAVGTRVTITLPAQNALSAA